MSRRLPLLAFALVLSLGCALLWKAMSAATGDVEESYLRAPGAAAEARAPDVPALPAALEGSTKREAATPILQSAAADAVRFIPADALWFDGRVIFPDNLPLEENYLVAASGRRFGADRETPRKHVVEAQPDGRFRVAFAKKTSTGYVALEARYMYLAAREKVKPKQGVREIVLKPLLGGVLRGIVAPPAGHAANAETFDGIRVRVHEWRSEGSVEKTSDVRTDGSYEVLGVPPGGDYVATLQTSRFYSESHSTVVIRAGEITDLDFALQVGVQLAGRVQDSAGQALKGARVNLMAASMADGWGHSKSTDTLTDEKGRFSFTGIEAGSMTIRVRAPGALDLVDELGEMENGAWRTDLLYIPSAGNSVSGVARWQDGSPAAGVAIEARAMELDGPLDGNTREHKSKTNEAGEFRLTGLDDRVFVLDATGRRPPDESRGGKKRGPVLSARVEGIPAGTHGIHLVLEAGEVLRGSVLLADGSPVGSFIMSAEPDWRNQGPLDSEDRVERRFRSEDGEYELTGLKPGSWQIAVKGRGLASSTGTLVRIPHEGRLDFTLSPVASLEGRLVTPRGEGLGGADVVLTRLEGGVRSWTINAAKTSSDGAFRVKFLEPGIYELHASAEGWASSDELSLTLLAGEQRAGLRLMARHTASLTGQLLAGAGEVAGRSVVARGVDSFETLSDSMGRFEFDDLEPGTYTVVLHQPLGSNKEDWFMRRTSRLRKRVELAAGETVYVELGDGPDEPIRVFGKVLCAGVGVAGYSLNFEDAERNKLQAARTDAGGAYSAIVDGAGSYSVTVRAPGSRSGASYNVFHVDVGAHGELRQDFSLPTGSLELSLVRPDGSPAAGVPVGLSSLDSASTQALVSGGERANADGQFAFRHLEPGSYHCRVGGRWSWGNDGGAFARQAFEVQVSAGATEKRQLSLEEGAHVRGAATYSDGRPAPGLQVRAFNSAGEELTVGYHSTDDTGRYDIGDLPSGSVRILVGQAPGAMGERTLQLVSGETGQADISVPR